MNEQRGKIIIPGGAGFIGQCLSDYFAQRGHEVVVLSRRASTSEGLDGVRYVAWDGETLGDWTRELDGAQAVVNMAGRSVNCRYNNLNKRAIYSSRLRSTRVLGRAIAACKNPPQVWINSSSATIYRHALDRAMDDETGELGKGFSVDVCRKWERELNTAATPQTRKIALRSAMVFGKGCGGVMDAFLRIVHLGLGGTLGSGDQYVSWIHTDDFCNSIQWILDHEKLEGTINVAAPHPLPNREFMRVLRDVCGQKFGLPATAWMLESGAFFLRTETELLLKSRRVVPSRLLRSGYRFQYTQWRDAAREIVG